MSAAAIDRRHVREVELAMEIVAAELAERDIDARQDAMRRRLWTFVDALGGWLRAHVAGSARVWAFLAGIVDAVRGEEALEQVDDARRDRELAAARELVGLLDSRRSGLAK